MKALRSAARKMRPMFKQEGDDMDIYVYVWHVIVGVGEAFEFDIWRLAVCGSGTLWRHN